MEPNTKTETGEGTSLANTTLIVVESMTKLNNFCLLKQCDAVPTIQHVDEAKNETQHITHKSPWNDFDDKHDKNFHMS